MVWRQPTALAVLLLLSDLAPPRYASAADLAVATGEPISCSDNGWIAVIIGKSGNQALIYCQLPGQDRVPLTRVKCPNEADRLSFTTNVVMSGILVDGQRRPTSARFHCYPRHPSEKAK